MSIKLTLAVLCVFVATVMGGVLKDDQSVDFHTVKVPGGCYHFEGNVTCDRFLSVSIGKDASVELYQKRDIKDSHLKKVELSRIFFRWYGTIGNFNFDACVHADQPGDDFEIYYLFENICKPGDQTFAVPFLSKTYLLRFNAKGIQKIEASPKQG